jgi:hypothetical protein
MTIWAALTAALVAGCGAAAATPATSAVAAPSSSLAASVAPSASAAPASQPAASGSAGPAVSGSASASASDPLGYPHVDGTLEDLLPSSIGNVTLVKFSLALSGYIASTPGAGEDALYTPWLVKFGKTPADVVIAVATDLTGQENFIGHAIRVPGVADSDLTSAFAEVAVKAGWPVTTHTNLMSTGKTVLEVIDPAARASGALFAGYVYAKNSVMYTIITDDSSLLLEALIKLP